MRRARSLGILMLLLAIATLPVTVACGDDGPGPAGSAIVEASSDKERITNPNASEQQLAQLVEGNSGFAMDLYRALRAEGGNLFFSPHSISVALAMTYAGARGQTETEMAETMRFEQPQEELHQSFNALDLELAPDGEPEAMAEEQRRFQLSITNALWGEREHEFLPEFLDTLAEHYGAGMQLVDFVGDPEGARQLINQWVSDQTEERIPELIPAGQIDPMTRLVLTNAIYFNAPWAFPFDEEATQQGAFHRPDGSEVQVPMMSQEARFPSAVTDGVKTVELPYADGEYSMVIIVPDEGEFERFESDLDLAAMQSVLDALGDSRVELTMPRFELDSSFSLKEVLGQMGMPSAFEPGQANFSGMDGSRDLFLSFVLHKAFVSVDELGTEAAAATAVGVATSAPPQQLELVVDRPFIFLIRHRQTGEMLFIGRVLDPSV